MGQFQCNLIKDNRLAHSGDKDAFSRLAHYYRPWLLAMAFLRTSDREAAQDLVQDVLARAWANLPSLQCPDAFAGWLQRIMVNACQTWLRHSERWPCSLEEIRPVAPSSLEPPSVLLARERQRALRDALLTLAPDNRLALLMHEWGDYSYAQIGELLEIPVSTVDGRIYRAKGQLRRVLSRQYAELFEETRRE